MKLKTALGKFFASFVITCLTLGLTSNVNAVKADESKKYVEHGNYSNSILKDGDPEGVFENEMFKLTKKILSYDKTEETYTVQLEVDGKEKKIEAGDKLPFHIILLLNAADYDRSDIGVDAAASGVEAGIATSKRVALEVWDKLVTYNFPNDFAKLTVVTAGEDGKVVNTWNLTNENTDDFKAQINGLEGEKGQFAAAGMRQAASKFNELQADNNFLIVVNNGNPTYAYAGTYTFTFNKKWDNQTYPLKPEYIDIEPEDRDIEIPVTGGRYKFDKSSLGYIYDHTEKTTYTYKKAVVKNLTDPPKRVFDGLARKRNEPYKFTYPTTSVAASIASAVHETKAFPEGTKIYYTGDQDSNYLDNFEKAYSRIFRIRMKGKVLDLPLIEANLHKNSGAVSNGKIEEKISDQLQIIGDIEVTETPKGIEKNTVVAQLNENQLSISASPLYFGKDDKLIVTYKLKLKDEFKIDNGTWYPICLETKFNDGINSYDFPNSKVKWVTPSPFKSKSLYQMDQHDNVVEGAKFNLCRQDAPANVIAELTANADGEILLPAGLADGQYYLIETETPVKSGGSFTSLKNIKIKFMILQGTFLPINDLGSLSEDEKTPETKEFLDKITGADDKYYILRRSWKQNVIPPYITPNPPTGNTEEANQEKKEEVNKDQKEKTEGEVSIEDDSTPLSKTEDTESDDENDDTLDVEDDKTPQGKTEKGEKEDKVLDGKNSVDSSKKALARTGGKEVHFTLSIQILFLLLIAFTSITFINRKKISKN